MQAAPDWQATLLAVQQDLPGWRLSMNPHGMALWLHVWQEAGAAYQLELTPGHGVGVTPVRPAEYAMDCSGHDHAFATLAEALAFIRADQPGQR
ncbi:hypothetical protein SAMN02745857_00884 [Andreprevotia lacus DSM 23236]|uniref:Uncharacterized protein n=1 Tax=Andreprevotia lacus DSM 23236 TaxID=1121001 RepID=A0A1W1X9P4_9NEIS|nr:hypothetical protein [Andreprevotia lacus]SMC20241.1 hypothetical protein SAMN02745857_00884 [Andreprevotia lacus DSM 23236]